MALARGEVWRGMPTERNKLPAGVFFFWIILTFDLAPIHKLSAACNALAAKEKKMKPEKWLLTALLAMFFWGNVFAAGGGRIESLDLLDKIKPGVTTAQQVREMFGPPARTMSFPRRGIDAIEYDAEDYGDCYVISISYGSDGVVREVMRLRRGGV